MKSIETEQLNLKTQKDVYSEFYDYGLGNILMLQRRDDEIFLGELTKENERIYFKDSGLIRDLNIVKVARCWDVGLIGCITVCHDTEWHSLTFLGPDLCDLPVDFTETRTGLFKQISGSFQASAGDYKGSIYRAFGAFLQENMIPIVLPTPIRTHSGEVGLAVADFRNSVVSLDILVSVQDAVTASIKDRQISSVEELELGSETFNQVFAKFHGHTDKI